MGIRTNIILSGFKGKLVCFFHCGGNPVVRGYWERKDGSEGGELLVDGKTNELVDYDGAFSLPSYIVKELQSLGINVPE